MKRFIYIIVVALSLVSCHTMRVKNTTPKITADTTLLPTFPAEVLYVLGAQWEADTLLQKQTPIDTYIEQRLIDLYPEKAYKGYVRKVCSIVDNMFKQNEHRPTLYIPKRSELSFVSPHNAKKEKAGKFHNRDVRDLYLYLDSLSMEQELALLELTPTEQSEWDQLQTLIHHPKFLTRESFDTLDISSFEEENLLLTVLLWRGPRMFYRIMQSKSRAEKLAHYYYGDATNNGRPGDAFKHIYVNVLLRTYVGEWMSHAVMDLFWEWKSPNAPCDHYMDLHNNIIGRQSRYNDFTAVEEGCDNSRHWLQWAENVQAYIQDTINGDKQNWNKETPTFIVEPAAEKVSAYQYIYWDK